MTEIKPQSEDLRLARRAARGERDAQAQVNELAHPVIDFQTSRFCQRFCRDNRYRYRCTLSQPVGSAAEDAALCEWGNASYAWMLDDLCKAERLQKYEGRNGAGLFDYLYSIANSLPFYERWKDWRFGRRQQVPRYIRELDDQAGKMFYALRAREPLAAIAQTLDLSQQRAEALAAEIVAELTRRQRLYLLDAPREVSLTEVSVNGDFETSHQQDVPVYDEDPAILEQRDRLRAAWAQLDPVEQFVLEAMLVEEQDAADVLAALQALDVEIKPGVSAADTNLQQLYYFRRKCVSRLGILLDSV